MGNAQAKPNPDAVDLSHFQIEKVVGEGGFGKVRQTTLQRGASLGAATTPHLCGHCICAHVSGFFVGTNWGSPAGAWPSCARPSEIRDTGLPVSRAHSRAWRGKVSISGASPHSMPSSTRLNSDPHTPTKQVLVVSSKTSGGGGIETGKLYAMKAMSKKVNSAVNALGWCG